MSGKSGHLVLWVEVNATEHAAAVYAIASKAGLSIPNFIRRCINGYLLEEGDDVPLLDERRQHKRKERTA